MLGRVAEVTPDKVTITIKDTRNKNAKPHPIDIPAGFVLWSTGIGMSPSLSGSVSCLTIHSDAALHEAIGRAAA